MNRNILLTAVLVLTAGAAFMAGRATNSSAGDQSSAAGSTPPPRQERASSSSSAFRPGTTHKTGDRANRDFRSDLTQLDEMVEIMATTDPLSRTQAWLDFVNTLDPARFEEVVDEFRSKGLTNGNMTEYAMLLTAWAKSDPLAALDYASENTGTSFARNTILTSWASSDPNGAIQWAKANHEGDDANPWLVGVIKGVSASDPELATQLMTEMPYSGERGEALSALLPQILKMGDDAAKDWVLGISDDRLRDGAIRRMAESLAKSDPEGTADWLVSNPGDGANGAMDNVIGSWARTDMDAAQAYYQNLPAGDLRTNALRGLSNQLAMSDPQAAASLIDANPGDASDRVYQQFVWHSFRQDPSIAANYIGRIGDTDTRDSTYRRMLDGWLRRDFEAASSWIGSNELPESVARRLNSRIEEIGQSQQ